MTVRERRAQLRISCRGIARKVGVSAMTISRWERGLRLPDCRHLAAWAAELGVSEQRLVAMVDAVLCEIENRRAAKILGRAA